MDLKNVLTFVTIARELSFAKASEILHLSQPSVTARIQTLETELDKKLFSRKSRNIQLTKEGEAFLPFAIQLLETKSEVEDKLKRITKSLEGKIVIGATAFCSVYILPTILGDILKKYPGIEIKVMTGNTVQITEMLVKNQVDIGLVSSRVTKKGIKEVHLSDYELTLVCSNRHPFSEKDYIGIDEMLKAQLVTYQQSSDAWKKMKKTFIEKDQKPNIVMELNQIEAAKQMISTSTCVCFLPTISVKEELERGEFKKIKVKELHPLIEKMSMIFLEKKESFQLIELVSSILSKRVVMR